MRQKLGTAFGVAIVLAMLLSLFLGHRQAQRSVCPVVLKDPRVLARYGPDATCAFKDKTFGGRVTVTVRGQGTAGYVSLELDGSVTIR